MSTVREWIDKLSVRNPDEHVAIGDMEKLNKKYLKLMGEKQ